MRRDADQGASAVEFALVLPVLVLLVMGIMQFGFIFAASQGLEAAAREGARLASLGRTVSQGDVVDAVRDATVLFVPDTDVIAVTAGPACSPGVADGDVEEVTVTAGLTGDDYGFSLIVWDGNRLLNPNLQATAVFRCEAPHTNW